MSNQAIITDTAKKDIVNKTDDLQDQLNFFENDFLSRLSAHENKGFDAHGVTVIVPPAQSFWNGTFGPGYIDTGGDIVGRVALSVSTNLGVLFVPASTSIFGP